MQEVWKDIPWYEWIYQISNLWCVKSIFDKRHSVVRDKILQWGLKKWYIWYILRKDGKEKTVFTHRLVAQVFLLNTNHYNEVNHKNGVKTDNRIENLEWCTRSENIQHSFKFLWRTTWNKKIKSISIDWNQIVYKSLREASRTLKIDNSSIIQVIQWKRKSAWWYKFQYI